MPIPRAASCETTSGPPGGWTAAPNTYIREEAKQSGPEKSVGRDSSEKKRGVCHVSLERQNTFGSRGAGHCPRPALTAALRRCAAATGTLPRAVPLPKRRRLSNAAANLKVAALSFGGDAIRCPEKWIETFVEAVVQADSAGADVIVSAGIPLQIRQTVVGKICEKLPQEAADARPLARRAQRWTSMPTTR